MTPYLAERDKIAPLCSDLHKAIALNVNDAKFVGHAELYITSTPIVSLHADPHRL